MYYDTNLNTYTSYHPIISFITRDGTQFTVTKVQSFQLFFSFTYVWYLSIYSQISYVFWLLQVTFSLLLSLFCICTPYYILDYYLPHVVVHNHTHMIRYKCIHLVIHWSSRHKSTHLVIHWSSRHKFTHLVIHRSPNHIKLTIGDIPIT